MIEQLKHLDKLDRTETFNALYTLMDASSEVKVYLSKQDYSGNYDETFNAYATLNTKECEQGLLDYFMDNVNLDGENKKHIEHLYYVAPKVSTYQKYVALKTVVNEALGHVSIATKNEQAEDFVVFDGAVVVLDVTQEGAIVGGQISTNINDVNVANVTCNQLKANSVPYLSLVKPESTMALNLKRKIGEYKRELKIK